MQTCTGFEGGNLLQNWGVCRDIVIYLWDIICSLVRLAVVRRFRYQVCFVVLRPVYMVNVVSFGVRQLNPEKASHCFGEVVI